MDLCRESLDLLIEKAPELRKAGIETLEMGAMKVTLAPPPSELPEGLRSVLADEDELSEYDKSPLDQAVTYGLPPGSAIPGFPKLSQ